MPYGVVYPLCPVQRVPELASGIRSDSLFVHHVPYEILTEFREFLLVKENAYCAEYKHGYQQRDDERGENNQPYLCDDAGIRAVEFHDDAVRAGYSQMQGVTENGEFVVGQRFVRSPFRFSGSGVHFFRYMGDVYIIFVKQGVQFQVNSPMSNPQTWYSICIPPPCLIASG